MSRHRTRGRIKYTYWCPHGCGKSVEYFDIGDYSNPLRGFYCKRCKKLIARTKKELKELI